MMPTVILAVAPYRTMSRGCKSSNIDASIMLTIRYFLCAHFAVPTFFYIRRTPRVVNSMTFVFKGTLLEILLASFDLPTNPTDELSTTKSSTVMRTKKVRHIISQH